MTEDLLANIFDALGETLLTRLQSGEATAAELNVARQWLRDNGIDSDGFHNSHVRSIAEAIPVFDEEDPVTGATVLPIRAAAASR